MKRKLIYEETVHHTVALLLGVGRCAFDVKKKLTLYGISFDESAKNYRIFYQRELDYPDKNVLTTAAVLQTVKYGRVWKNLILLLAFSF